MNAVELASRIDHTLLKPEATSEQVDRLCDEAVEFRFASICVNSVFVPQVVKRVGGSGVAVCSVVNFPLGASMTDTVVNESRRLVELGAGEIDMVAWVGGLIGGETLRVTELISETAGVVHAGGCGRILKVILETAALSDEQIVIGCECCRSGGADFVKTSTGFHAGGGATLRHMRLLRRHAIGLRVKASGGIRDLSTALAMIEAGADRLGTSSGASLVRGFSG